MPFQEGLKEVYEHAIAPACKKAGFQAVRVDELEGIYNINQKIIEHIFDSDAIIADLTAWRPNVFYELGVAHAIDNKTIMIIQNKDEVPFDVGPYRCIKYDQNEVGLAKLSVSIIALLTRIEEWRKHPTNPVQQYRPHDAFVPKSALDEMQNRLQQKNELLNASPAKSDWNALQQALKEKEKLFSHIEELQKELAQRQIEVTTLQNEISHLKSELAEKEIVLKSQKEISLDDNILLTSAVRLAHSSAGQQNVFPSNKERAIIIHRTEQILNLLLQTVIKLLNGKSQFVNNYLESTDLSIRIPRSVDDMKQFIFMPSLSHEQFVDRLRLLKHELEALIFHQLALLSGYRFNIREGTRTVLQFFDPNILIDELNKEINLNLGMVPTWITKLLFQWKFLNFYRRKHSNLLNEDFNFFGQHFRVGFIRGYYEIMQQLKYSEDRKKLQ